MKGVFFNKILKDPFPDLGGRSGEEYVIAIWYSQEFAQAVSRIVKDHFELLAAMRKRGYSVSERLARVVGNSEIKLRRSWCEINVMFHIAIANLEFAYRKNTILTILIYGVFFLASC